MAEIHFSCLCMQDSGRKVQTCYDQWEGTPREDGTTVPEDAMRIEDKSPATDPGAGSDAPNRDTKPSEGLRSGEEVSSNSAEGNGRCARDTALQEFQELIRSAPDIRQDLVDRLRKEIETGVYRVDAEKIAEKLISGGFLKNKK
jgi:flagellar biosynthesis anti-sigma factor FlgM